MSNGLQSDVSQYRSPVRKLAVFFERSRDNWKRKCQESKKQCKLLGNQVRAVEKSREQWRLRAEQSEEQLRVLRHELEELKRAACGK